MKTTIPEELKSDMPQTLWGKILAATPVVMTVIATALAGLASSEMTRAQYNRSLAAQLQSKAGDQWGFFQAKRLRGALQRNTLDILQSTAAIQPMDNFPGQLPDLPPATSNAAIQSALEAIESSPSADAMVLSLPDETLQEAVRAAKERAQAFDRATKPINQAIEKQEGASPSRDFIAARLRYSAARYDAEAKLNQGVASLYELQVRRSNLIAERHHKRSQRFFYGMLGAQAAVIIATFAMAARKRSLLWSLAAAAGMAAVSFGVYVYLFV